MSAKFRNLALAVVIALATQLCAPQKAQAYCSYSYNAYVYFTWATDHAWNHHYYYGGPYSYESYYRCWYSAYYSNLAYSDPSYRYPAVQWAADAYVYADLAWRYSNGNSHAYWAAVRAYDGYVAAWYAYYYC